MSWSVTIFRRVSSGSIKADNPRRHPPRPASVPGCRFLRSDCGCSTAKVIRHNEVMTDHIAPIRNASGRSPQSIAHTISVQSLHPAARRQPPAFPQSSRKIRQQLFFDGGFRASGLYALSRACARRRRYSTSSCAVRAAGPRLHSPGLRAVPSRSASVVCRSNHLFSPLLAGMMPAVSD